jgi:AraC-like DNA-binding protein
MHNLQKMRQPQVLVENRISFSGADSELCIYDTYASAKRIRLDAGEMLLCGMVSGKKIMHSKTVANRHDEQVFLPHESFIMAPGERVEIDFPGASLIKPTTCLTIEISKDKISNIHEKMCDLSPVLSDDEQWQQGKSFPILHTHHSSETQRILDKLTHLFIENHPDRNLLIDLNITELIVRMLRHNTRDFLLRHCAKNPEANSLLAALSWINTNLTVHLDIDKLCKHTCMSRSSLYVLFKEQLGCSPVELQQQLRLKQAARRIKNGETVTSISYDLGFSTPSHFCQRFKNFFGCTATQYKGNN